MKRILLLLFIAGPLITNAQITTPQIKARFGVDADLRANFFNGLVQAGNDDWYNQFVVDTSGKMVIDTTGCAAVIAGYLSDVSPFPRRMASYFRTMSRPTFSIVNNRLWLDALWIRDYHGTDTTVFTSGSDKNGMSPVLWTGGIQGIPDKNDILDMFIHIRRAGPNTTDSLWFFGGLSLDNTTGNRYFDFEMYQTDIYYDRVSGKWFGYGPDFGHTSWQFDAAGNILKAGDIIFSGEYQSSTLTNIEARVWVAKSVWQTITPVAFNWSGQFDGDGAAATYGYASIQPKTAGAFYTGLGSAVNTWAGFFRLILQNNSLVTTYAKDQFMEFSVNLSKLGLDPVTQIGGDICGTPFNRIVVKTRSSASFTSELKDFVAPTDLFLAPRVMVDTDTPSMCDTGSIAQIFVTNPSPTSFYEWSTINGNIVGPTTGTTIYVDTPGIYIVKQYLQVGCSVYASDTIEVTRLVNCDVLQTSFANFSAVLNGLSAQLDWRVLNNSAIRNFGVERSNDGIHFTTIGTVDALPHLGTQADYAYLDQDLDPGWRFVYYRIRINEGSGAFEYSNIIKLSLKTRGLNGIGLFPNPASNLLHLEVNAETDGVLLLVLHDFAGKKVKEFMAPVRKGYNLVNLGDITGIAEGVYNARALVGAEVYNKRIVIVH